MDRRRFLKHTGYLTGALLTRTALATPPPIPVIDTHIHLFDPTRPGGVPWPEKTDLIRYKPALPARFAQVSANLNVVGAIAIEASPLPADNDWLLNTAAQSPVIVGVIGDLDPAAPSFAADLDRLRPNPLFRGIRYGNLWGRDLSRDLAKPGFLAGLERLADAGLVLDSANPTPALIHTLADLSTHLPHLTLVVDHLPNITPPTTAPELQRYLHDLHTLSASPAVFVKLSAIAALQPSGNPADLSLYQTTLDQLWQIFGEDKLMYGSDWPNSDPILPYPKIFGLLHQYMQSKSFAAQEKIYWRNSRKAYTWQRRTQDQPNA